MFNFNTISAEQPSVDIYRFYHRVLWTSFRQSGNFPIDSMLTINHRCCQMFISLLNNHINKLNIVKNKIINITKCRMHAPGIGNLDNAIAAM